MVKKIFISHSHGDTSVASALVDLIESCCGVNAAEIFCSSVEGLGGKNGKILSKDVREKLLESDFVITYLSKNYRNSEFCLAELGAIWILSEKKNFIPLSDPSLSDSVFNGVIAGVNIGCVNDETIHNMIDEIGKKYPKEVSSIRIARKIKKFIEDYPQNVKMCEPGFFVSEEDWEIMKDELEEAHEKQKELENELKKLKKANELLKKAKNKEDVEKAELAACDDVIEQYKVLVERVNDSSCDFNRFTKRFILLDNYNMENSDDINYYADNVTESVSNDYLRRNEDSNWPDVNYSEETVQEYVSALDELKEFLDDPENVEDLLKYFKSKKIRFNTNQLKFYQAILGI